MSGLGGKYQVVHTQCTTIASTQDVTASSGFGDVCCVMLYWVGATNAGTQKVDAMIGCGATDFTRSWAGLGFTEDAIGKTNCVQFGSTVSSIIFCNDTGTALTFGATVSRITDGVQLDWKFNPTDSFKFSVVFFGGSSLHCEVGSKINDNSLLDTSHIVTFSDMTVVPEVLLFYCNGKNAFDIFPTPDLEFSWGMAAVSGGIIQEACFGWADDDNRTAGGRHAGFTGNDYCMKVAAYAGGRVGYALSAVGVTGSPKGTFTLLKKDQSSTQSYGYLALSWEGLGNYHVGIPNMQVGSTGDVSPNTPMQPNFRGQFLLAYGSNLQTNNANNSAALGGVAGVQIIDSVNNNPGAYQVGSDEVDPSDAFSLFNERIVDMRDEEGNVSYQSTWVGWTDDTWTINVTVNSANAKRWPALTLGFVDASGDGGDPIDEEPLMWGRAF